MFVKSAVALCGMASTAMALNVGDRPMLFGCGTGRPTEEFLGAASEMRLQESELTARGVVNPSQIVVNTYINVVARDRTVSGGYITADTVAKQFKVLVDTYNSTGVSFVLKKTTWTINPGWSSDSNEVQMKKSLRRGTYQDLNLYFLKELSGPAGTLGYCRFPGTVQPGTNAFYTDGCSLNVGTVPGGPISGFNLGKTTTHEVGHWFGLMHTFQGQSCSGDGDQVDDTPVQSSPTQGCPAGRDSCPGMPGLDPIHNYMDYSSDACYDQFTPGQANRIRSLWYRYRATQ